MDAIAEMIYENRWAEASEAVWEKLNKGEFDDTLAILVATIYEHFGNDDGVYSFILKGLEYNYRNYELYMMLGNYYADRNANQAYLCYENAEYYCEINGNNEDFEYISQIKDEFKKENDINVPPFSFVILSDNTFDWIKACIASIKLHCKRDTFEIIIVDNASTDGSREWLLSQEDIILICNEEHVGISTGFNQGIAAASKNNDIMLLNSDTIMMPNAMFTLRMGLYASHKHGIAWSVANNSIEVSISEYINYAVKNNLPGKIYEYRPILNSCAKLIKRIVLDVIGGKLDERFTVYEYYDLCMRVLSYGYCNILCWNSFIFYGCEQRGIRLIQEDEIMFKEKWGISPIYYASSRTDLMSMITKSEDTDIHVLEVGCGLGATLGAIKHKFPNSGVYGVEVVKNVAKLGSACFDIICADIEDAVLPYEKGFFDYIIFGDVLEHLKYPEAVLIKIKEYLKPDGCVIASIPNLMNAENIYQILHGFFPYEDSGIRDRTHLRFFTFAEIECMMQRTGYQIIAVNEHKSVGSTTNDFKDFFDRLLDIPGVAERQQFDVLQYLVCAKKMQI